MDETILTKLEQTINKQIGLLTELNLFLLLRKSIFKSLQKVDNTFSKHDCIIKDGCVELKCRRTHYDTLLIEKDKYDHMQQFKKKYYICSTPQGIYCFDLDKINPIWEKTYNPSTTEFNNKSKKLKETYYIPIEDGKNITGLILSKLNDKIV